PAARRACSLTDGANAIEGGRALICRRMLHGHRRLRPLPAVAAEAPALLLGEPRAGRERVEGLSTWPKCGPAVPRGIGYQVGIEYLLGCRSTGCPFAEAAREQRRARVEPKRRRRPTSSGWKPLRSSCAPGAGSWPSWREALWRGG